MDSFIEGQQGNKRMQDAFIGKITAFALENGLNGNLWKAYILYTLILNENSYTKTIERNQNCKAILPLAAKELEGIYDLYEKKEDWMLPILHFEYPVKKTVLSNVIHRLQNKIKNYITFEKGILDFYTKQGVGDMALYKAFRVEQGVLSPIYYVLDVGLEDLVGYEEQKKLLVENTENFIYGKSYNNVLLYGDSGTGKSTSVKAILNTYFEKGLRVIEVYKHQMEEIAKIIYLLKSRPYFYVIYMDDLSFEEDEIEYKYLKSIIEGGIEPKPENVVIYATSNRRHLIKETFMDNQTDDLHRNETQAEKLSLAYRFGLQIFYSSLSPKEFKNMVLELAKRHDLDIEEELLLKEASKWELSYGSLSGRCATQFIDYISSKVK